MKKSTKRRKKEVNEGGHVFFPPGKTNGNSRLKKIEDEVEKER